jgi:single-strand DNA-binding protein
MAARTAPASRPTRAATDAEGADPAAVNDVLLVGRLAATPEVRSLPSGDVVVTFRLVVDRPARRHLSGSAARVDTLDCAAFRSDVRRRCQRWEPGDVVEVRGSLRRRFFRTGGGPASRYEVEVATASRVARAPARPRATMTG